MEQRRVRLGDELDDYCPRERRITNHAVVAMIDDQIRQTRCVTCDAEHVYKGARLPVRRKKKDAPGMLYEQVLATMPEAEEPGAPAEPPPARVRAGTVTAPRRPEPLPPEPEAEFEPPAAAGAPDGPVEDGPVHRPLIRATLPRPEGQAVARPAPDFTIRQTGGRNGHFRDQIRGGSRSGRPGNGPKPHLAVANRPGSARPDRSAGRLSGPHAHGRPRPPAHARAGRPAQARPGKKRSR
jgi:hypothetical protein